MSLQTENKKFKDIKEKIGDNDIEIFLLYKLVGKTKKRDIDNYTKSIIDSYKNILFNDDKQIRLLISKIDYLDDRKYGASMEKVIIRLDYFGKSPINLELDELFNNPYFDYIPIKEEQKDSFKS